MSIYYEEVYGTRGYSLSHFLAFTVPQYQGRARVAGRENRGNFQIFMLSGEVGCRGKAKAKEGGVVCHQVGCGGCFA